MSEDGTFPSWWAKAGHIIAYAVLMVPAMYHAEWSECYGPLPFFVPALFVALCIVFALTPVAKGSPHAP